MTASILTKKKRLDMALELMPNGLGHYYDLFCDHGLLGLELKRREPHSTVLWNDIRDPLLSVLAAQYNIQEECLIRGKAQDIQFESCAGIFLLGVGGHLMAECLHSWSKSLQFEQKGQYFVLAPTYYQLSLRDQLMSLGARLIRRSFVYERGVGHEFFLVSFGERELNDDFNWRTFDGSFWEGVILNDISCLDYLKKKNVSLKKNRHLSQWEQNYSVKLDNFLCNFS